MATLLKKRIRMQGFIIGQDYGHRIHEFQQEMGRWVKEGKSTTASRLPTAWKMHRRRFIGLLTGKNFGKVVIRLADDA